MAKSVRLNRSTRGDIHRSVCWTVRDKYKAAEPMKTLEGAYIEAVLVDLAVYTKEMVAIATEQGIEKYLDYSFRPGWDSFYHRIGVAGEQFTYFIPDGEQYLCSKEIYDRYTSGTAFHDKFSKKWAIAGKLRRDNALIVERVRKNKITDIEKQARSVIDAANTTAQLEATFEDIARHYPWEIKNALS